MTVPLSFSEHGDAHGGTIARSAEMSKTSWKRWRTAERKLSSAHASVQGRLLGLLSGLCSGHRAPAVAVSNLIARGSGAAADVHTLRMVLNDSDLWEAPEKDGPSMEASPKVSPTSPLSLKSLENCRSSPRQLQEMRISTGPCTVHLDEVSTPRSTVSLTDSDFGLSGWQLEAPGKAIPLLDAWQASEWQRKMERMASAATAVAEKSHAAALLECCFRSWSKVIVQEESGHEVPERLQLAESLQ
mmetsp:Transcript_114527/g.160803  ORF Transcript_114527/g.160803 Transcript_114527/m.160803 type:complete len:244 (-) Transcript_114527:30-761(-)